MAGHAREFSPRFLQRVLGMFDLSSVTSQAADLPNLFCFCVLRSVTNARASGNHLAKAILATFHYGSAAPTPIALPSAPSTPLIPIGIRADPDTAGPNFNGWLG
jgi:hypothetical protein